MVGDPLPSELAATRVALPVPVLSRTSVPVPAAATVKLWLLLIRRLPTVMVTPVGMVMVRLAVIAVTKEAASPTALGKPLPSDPDNSIQLFGAVHEPSASTRQPKEDGTVRSSSAWSIRRARRGLPRNQRRNTVITI